MAIPECHNFLVGGVDRATGSRTEDLMGSSKRRAKESTIQRMSQDLDRIVSMRSGMQEARLPFNCP